MSHTTASKDSFLICGICKNQLDDPRLLPCFHTYCLKCMKTEAQKHQQEFICPRNDGTRIAARSIDALRVNGPIVDIIEQRKLAAGEMPCSNCNRPGTKYWCDKCELILCENCSKTIHDQRAFRDHKPGPLQGTSHKIDHCQIHSDEKLKYWCKQCNTHVCSECLLNIHSNHSYDSYQNIVQQFKEQTHNSLRDLETTLNDKLHNVNTTRDDSDSNYHKNRQQIIETTDQLQKMVENHKKQTLERLDAIEKDDKKNIDGFTNNLELDLEYLSTQKQILQELRQYPNSMRILTVKPDIDDYSNRLKNRIYTLKQPERRSYHIDGVEEVPVLREKIFKCGELVVKPNPTGSSWSTDGQNIQTRLSQNQSKERLDLGRSVITENDMEHLSRQIQNNFTFHELHLNQCQIDDQGVKILADSLKKSQIQQLTVLNLSYNSIGDAGAQYLAEALERNKTITKLDLYKNHISDEGAQCFSQMLQKNKTLVQLHLSDNRIGDRGVRHLAETLTQNTTLKILHLAQNQIGSQGANHLADALKYNRALTVLNLYSNNIDDQGAKFFADGLLQNRTLTSLYLGHNRISKNGANDLAHALQRNPVLTTLTLNQNPIEQQTEKAIKELLNKNENTMLF